MTTQPNDNAQPSAPADDLDGLLAEYDRGATTKPAAEPPSAPAAQSPPAEIAESFSQRILRKAQEREARLRDAVRPKESAAEQTKHNDRLSQLEEFAAGIEAERSAAREKEEAQKVFDQAAQIAGEVAPWLPGEMAKAWLLNEVATDGDLAQAWSERHNSPEHALIAERRINRALQKLRSYAKSLPDPKATDDRSLVTAAVRGAAVKPPPERPPNYNSMSDAEFDREMRTKYGINTRLA